MKLTELLPGLAAETSPVAQLRVSGLQDDSRKVRPGDLFFAIEGLTVDGHDYAAAAAGRGAAAVVAGRPLDLSVPVVVVEHGERLLGEAAARFHRGQGAPLSLVGITGTNGKTTTAYLVESIFLAVNRPVGVVGTVSYRYAGNEEPADYTTPPPLILQPLLARMAKAGCESAVLEVSSHALQMGRVWGCEFDVAAFSQITQDHLDLHGDMESYFAAKKLLFDRHLKPGGVAVVNQGGSGGDRLIAALQSREDLRLLRVAISESGSESSADLQLVNARYSLAGIEGELVFAGQAHSFICPLVGAFNAENILLAAACTWASGLAPGQIVQALSRPSPVPGRLEFVEAEPGGGPAVFVDYAHTPDALHRVLEVLRPLCRGRLITVFGCGGDRDRGKRPLMGAAVAKGSDLAVVTSDNPRSESPPQILADIVQGLTAADFPREQTLEGTRGYVVEESRQKAIEMAITAARPEDVVLIAGKGHETYQILADQRIHFDDREQARLALKGRNT